MAEVVMYDDSPLAEFLTDVGQPEPSIQDPSLPPSPSIPSSSSRARSRTRTRSKGSRGPTTTAPRSPPNLSQTDALPPSPSARSAPSTMSRRSRSIPSFGSPTPNLNLNNGTNGNSQTIGRQTGKNQNRNPYDNPSQASGPPHSPTGTSAMRRPLPPSISRRKGKAFVADFEARRWELEEEWRKMGMDEKAREKVKALEGEGEGGGERLREEGGKGEDDEGEDEGNESEELVFGEAPQDYESPHDSGPENLSDSSSGEEGREGVIVGKGTGEHHHHKVSSKASLKGKGKYEGGEEVGSLRRSKARDSGKAFGSVDFTHPTLRVSSSEEDEEDLVEEFGLGGEDGEDFEDPEDGDSDEDAVGFGDDEKQENGEGGGEGPPSNIRQTNRFGKLPDIEEEDDERKEEGWWWPWQWIKQITTVPHTRHSHKHSLSTSSVSSQVSQPPLSHLLATSPFLLRPHPNPPPPKPPPQTDDPPSITGAFPFVAPALTRGKPPIHLGSTGCDRRISSRTHRRLAPSFLVFPLSLFLTLAAPFLPSNSPTWLALTVFPLIFLSWPTPISIPIQLLPGMTFTLWNPAAAEEREKGGGGPRGVLMATAKRLLDNSQKFDGSVAMGLKRVGEVEGAGRGLGIGVTGMPPVSRLEFGSLAPYSDEPPSSAQEPTRAPPISRMTRADSTSGLPAHRCAPLRKTIHGVLSASLVSCEATTRALEASLKAPGGGSDLEEGLREILEFFGLPAPPLATPAPTPGSGNPRALSRASDRGMGHSRSNSGQGSESEPQSASSSSMLLTDQRERDREQFIKALWVKQMEKSSEDKLSVSGGSSAAAKRQTWSPADGFGAGFGKRPGSAGGNDFRLSRNFSPTMLEKNSRPGTPGGASSPSGSPDLKNKTISFGAGRSVRHSLPVPLRQANNKGTSSQQQPGSQRLDLLFERDDEWKDGTHSRFQRNRQSMLPNMGLGLTIPEHEREGETTGSSIFENEEGATVEMKPSSNLESIPASAGIETDKDPLLLKNLRDDFEAFHRDRKRVLCCLLALDQQAEEKKDKEEEDERYWLYIDSVVGPLADALEAMHRDVITAFNREFGDNAFDALESSTGLSRQDPLPLKKVSGFPGAWPGTLSPNDEAAPDSAKTARPPTGFAPPNPTSLNPRDAALRDLSSCSSTMNAALRSATAKLHVIMQDLETLERFSDPIDLEVERERILNTHESIREDVERLSKQWSESRLIVRRAIQPPREDAELMKEENDEDIPMDVSASDSAAIDIMDASEEEPSLTEARTSSIFSSDQLTADDWDAHLASHPGPLTQDQVEDLSEMLLRDTSPSYLPSPGQEQVFEAVSEKLNLRGSGGMKLTREERIKLAKEQREKDKVVNEKKEGEKEMQTGMVRELKDVITIMKQRRMTAESQRPLS